MNATSEDLAERKKIKKMKTQPMGDPGRVTPIIRRIRLGSTFIKWS